MDCSPPGSSVHGIFQARILEWVAIPSPGDLPDPGSEPASPPLAGRFFTTEPPGKPTHPQYTGTELGTATGGARGQLISPLRWSEATQRLRLFPRPLGMKDEKESNSPCCPSLSCEQPGSQGRGSLNEYCPFSCDRGK